MGKALERPILGHRAEPAIDKLTSEVVQDGKPILLFCLPLDESNRIAVHKHPWRKGALFAAVRVCVPP